MTQPTDTSQKTHESNERDVECACEVVGAHPCAVHQRTAIDREVEIVNLVTDLQSIPPEMWTDATDSNDEGRAMHAVAAALHEMGWRRG